MPERELGTFIRRNADGTVNGNCKRTASDQGRISCTKLAEKMMFFEFMNYGTSSDRTKTNEIGLANSAPVIYPVDEYGEPTNKRFGEVSDVGSWAI